MSKDFVPEFLSPPPMPVFLPPAVPPVPSAGSSGPPPAVPPKPRAHKSERDKLLARLHRRFDARHEAEELMWADDERPCRHCRQPTRWRTSRGAAIHPTCGVPLWPLSDLGESRVIFDVARVLGGRVTLNEPSPARPIDVATGQCNWCTTPSLGYAITADEYFHCKVHLHFPYIWKGAPQ